MTNLNSILEEYKALNTTLAIEEERELLYKYVYATNKLEGNQLTFAQIERIDPLSTPTTVAKNMENLVKSVWESDRTVVEKSAFLAQELWLHQPFVDKNKRTGRLAINFLTLKVGFPLFVFEDKSKNYNSLLVEQYIEKKPGLVSTYIEKALVKTMNYYLKMNNNKGGNTGFRMVL